MLKPFSSLRMGFGVQEASNDEIQVSHLCVLGDLRFSSIKVLVYFGKVLIKRVKEDEGGRRR